MGRRLRAPAPIPSVRSASSRGGCCTSRTRCCAATRRTDPSYNPAFLHPDDMAELGVAAGDVVEIESRRGGCWASSSPTRRSDRASCSMSHCYGDLPEVEAADVSLGGNTARLVDPDVDHDPFSGQPRMSDIPVRVRKRTTASPPTPDSRPVRDRAGRGGRGCGRGPSIRRGRVRRGTGTGSALIAGAVVMRYAPSCALLVAKPIVCSVVVAVSDEVDVAVERERTVDLDAVAAACTRHARRASRAPRCCRSGSRRRTRRPGGRRTHPCVTWRSAPNVPGSITKPSTSARWRARCHGDVAGAHLVELDAKALGRGGGCRRSTSVFVPAATFSATAERGIHRAADPDLACFGGAVVLDVVQDLGDAHLVDALAAGEERHRDHVAHHARVDAGAVAARSPGGARGFDRLADLRRRVLRVVERHDRRLAHVLARGEDGRSCVRPPT